MSRRNIVITGMGVVCAAGEDTAVFSRSLREGSSALTPLADARIAHFGTIYAGVVPGPLTDPAQLCGEDRIVKLADRALGEAIRNAALDPGGCGYRAGIFMGTCSGPMLTIETLYGPSRKANTAAGERPLLKRKQYYDMAELLAARYSIGGPAFTVTTACSAFCAALVAAADLLRIGILDVAFVGGADSLSLTTLAGFVGLKAVNASRCAPFSLPIGLNLGEGAGVVVLETGESAQAREARVIATIEGYGLSNDAYHCSAPDPTGRGAAAAISSALADAAISRSDISYINAHGTGTDANDKSETKAIRRIFGDDARATPPVSSTKAVVGHCLGAAGAVETVATLLCAREKVLPPTVNFSGNREGCTLDYIADRGREWAPGSRWLKNNFAFGGNNASIVVRNGAPEKSAGSGSPGLLDEPVAISAIGIVSAAGVATPVPSDEYFTRVVAPTERTTERHGAWPVCSVPVFSATDIDRRLSIRGIDRAGHLAVAAAALALKAGKGADRGAKSATGFVMNIAQGSSWAEAEHVGRLLDHDFHLDQINSFPYIVPNAVTDTVARALSLTGFNTTFCNGPGASLPGLVASWAAIKNRHAASLLCGGVDDLTEAGVFDCMVAEFGNGPRPVLGEGAVMMLLEPLSAARAGGAEPFGTVIDAVFTGAGSDVAKAAGAAAAALLGEHGIGPDNPLVVCAADLNGALVGELEGRGFSAAGVDRRAHTGWMPCCQPLLDTAAALLPLSIGNTVCAKYILTFLCSPQGRITIVLLEKNVTRKSE